MDAEQDNHRLRADVVQSADKPAEVHLILDEINAAPGRAVAGTVGRHEEHAGYQLDPEHERQVAAVLVARGHDAVCSHEVSPEFREYERMVTTVVDAILRPVCRGYLSRLANLADEVADRKERTGKHCAD